MLLAKRLSTIRTGADRKPSAAARRRCRACRVRRDRCCLSLWLLRPL